MEAKYKINDLVIINKIFCNKDWGKWIQTDNIVARIIRVSKTPTFGYCYSLKISGETLKVMYWEDDINNLATTDQDYIWQIWGDQ